jgi:hypothetical protein
MITRPFPKTLGVLVVVSEREDRTFCQCFAIHLWRFLYQDPNEYPWWCCIELFGYWQDAGLDATL